MATSKITVYQNGKPKKNVKVSLEYTGWSQNGFTKSFYTNNDGIAYVEHSSTGNAKVYLNGNPEGSLTTPGQEIFYL